MTPGSRLVALSRGVVLRMAKLQMATVWLRVPLDGCRYDGARLHAWMVVFEASLGLRMSPACS